MFFEVSLTDINSFASNFWSLIGDSKLFAFHGDMGAGKTTIITSLCHAKQVEGTMGSPTFSIINEYEFVEKGEMKKIYHIDLYRLKDEEEVVQAGVEDCIYSGEICMVEWPEKAPDLFDETTVHVFVAAVSETLRKIEVKREVV